MSHMGHFLSRVDSSLQLGKVLFSRYVTRSVVRIQWHEFSQCLQCCVACSESFVVTFWTGNRTTDYIVSVFLYGTYKHLCADEIDGSRVLHPNTWVSSYVGATSIYFTGPT